MRAIALQVVLLAARRPSKGESSDFARSASALDMCEGVSWQALRGGAAD